MLKKIRKCAAAFLFAALIISPCFAQNNSEEKSEVNPEVNPEVV